MSITYEEIVERMLENVPDNIDKREGSVIYDAVAPAAAEIMLMYIEAENVLKQGFAKTADREYLIKRAQERGIEPFAATKAVFRAVIKDRAAVGDRLCRDDFTFEITEDEGDNRYILTCEQYGSGANSCLGKVIPCDYIDGFTSGEIIEVVIPGEDEETTEDLRTRFFESVANFAFGGNVADYKNKIKAIEGVGGVRIYPVYNGGGTVRVVIVNSDFDCASQELISSVKNTMDPEEASGMGIGLAPIGHKVTVESAGKIETVITVEIVKEADANEESLKSEIESVIRQYFKELCQNFESDEANIIRISRLESRILDISGIIDVLSLSINGQDKNVTIDDDKIPSLSSVTVSVSEGA